MSENDELYKKIKEFLISIEAHKFMNLPDVEDTLCRYSLNNYIIAKKITGDDFIAAISALSFVFISNQYSHNPLLLTNDTSIQRVFGSEVERLVKLYNHLYKYKKNSLLRTNKNDGSVSESDLVFARWIDYVNLDNNRQFYKWPGANEFLNLNCPHRKK